jgi:hypothetical protein
MPHVISTNQTTFIAGRKILDGFMIANEMVHRIKKSGGHGLILKVNFHKTFDSVQWDYLDEVMMFMGFSTKWRTIINYECISGSHLAILINGSRSQEFSVKGGLRQGDPLSSFLFDIVAEGLFVLFQRPSASGYFKGIEYRNGEYLSHTL